MKCFCNPSVALALITLGIASGFDPSLLNAQVPIWQPRPETPPAPVINKPLQIIVLKGNNGVNVVRLREAVTPVVEVRDENNQPIAGALVEFRSPDTAAGVTFINGRRFWSTVTEVSGRARAACIPVGVGTFQIDVTASYDQRLSSVRISQTNFRTATDVTQAGLTVPPPSIASVDKEFPNSHHGPSTGVVIGIIAAGATAAGLVLGLHHGAAASATGSVGVGTPTAGAPH